MIIKPHIFVCLTTKFNKNQTKNIVSRDDEKIDLRNLSTWKGMRPNNTSRRKVLTYSVEIHRSSAGDYSMSLLSTHVVEVFKAHKTKEVLGS
jgi:hypothetical protein